MSITEGPMAMPDPTATPEPHDGNGSVPAASAPTLKERLAKRRRELEQNTTFELPVLGYEADGLWARYRALGYAETRAIGLRIEGETNDQASGERLTAAETLAEACVELLEITGTDDEGKPTFQSLGYRWTAQAAREFFDIDLPEGVVARDAITYIFPYPRDILMMKHFDDYISAAMGFLPEIEQILMGESRAPSGATTSVSSPQQQHPEYP